MILEYSIIIIIIIISSSCSSSICFCLVFIYLIIIYFLVIRQPNCNYYEYLIITKIKLLYKITNHFEFHYIMMKINILVVIIIIKNITMINKNYSLQQKIVQ